MLPGRANEGQRLLRIVQGQDQHAGLARPRSVEQIVAGGVSVVHLEAHSAKEVDPVRVDVQDGRGDAVRTQEAAHGRTEAPEPGDEDGGPGVDVVGGTLGLGLPGTEARPQPALVAQEQKGCDGHGEGDGRHQGAGGRGVQNALLLGEREEHEGEFADLGEGQGEEGARVGPQAETPRQQGQHRQLHAHDAQGEGHDGARGIGHQPEVQRGSHGDEEDPEEQTLEGLDVGLQFVAVLAVGQHYACEEGPERGAQPHPGHEQGDADHQEQRRGREDLPESRAAQDPEGRAHQHPPSPDHRHHGAQNGQGLGPRRQAHQPGRRLVAPLGGVDLGRGQQRHEGQHGDHGDVLEEQDGEGRLPGRGPHQPLLLEGLEDHGRGRQGEGHAHGQRRGEGETHGHGDPGADGGGEGDLESPETQDRTPEAPEHRRPQLQADDEEHHDHAELGEVHDVLALAAHPSEAPGPDDHAGDQVPEHRPQSQPSGQGYGHDRGGQVDHGLGQERLGAHAVPSIRSTGASMPSPRVSRPSSATHRRRRS